MDFQIRKIPMALLRDVEEPREFPVEETPNGASPALEKLSIVTTQASIHFYRSVINKPVKPFSCNSRNDGL